ncbi:MAG: type VI secretion system baseplate subunit TssE [Deltaproteobacteria bacterium]|nr:type VI secretion system baseplate subunit TssE [Deltaproteobacteria bacterium]
MADPSQSEVLRPSLMDRLIGGGGDGQRGLRPYVGIRELREAVGRDLEWLLNSKQSPLDLDAYPEAKRSLLSYGVPDFSGYSWRSARDGVRIAAILEEVIERFEPRLAPGSIRVDVQPAGEVDDFRMKFRIDALLRVDPVSEPVSFDTQIDFENAAVKITGSS